MKYNINYGKGVCVIPQAFFEISKRASSADILVFLAICDSQGSDIDASSLAKKLKLKENQVSESISFWRGGGLLESAESNETDTNLIFENENSNSQKATDDEFSAENEVSEETRAKKLRRSDSLPNYTTEEVAQYMESNTGFQNLLTECQNVVGKVFNVHEVNVVIGLVDYLDLDYEYILMLFAYCVGLGKKSLHYIEKTAFDLYDSGMTDANKLSEELKRRENFKRMESKLRAMFGMGERYISQKEQKMMSAWISDMKFSYELILKAYEITVDKIGKASVSYVNAILDRWNAQNLRTEQDIDNAQLAYEEILKSVKRTKGKNAYRYSDTDETSQNSTFATDEFFDAAVKRALGDDNE